jgi:aryl-alcohol dehydrogenase-like predicted oxidoreductase
MRYRPIGPAGGIISAISLSLRGDPARRPGDWVSLIYAALENGISGFDVREPDLALAEGLREAFAGVDRRLAFVSWRLGMRPDGQGIAGDFSADTLTEQIRAALGRTGLEQLDAVMLEDPEDDALPDEAIEALTQCKSDGLVRLVGVTGEGDSIDDHIVSGAFDLLETPFNLMSGWRERHRLRWASSSNMSVIGYRTYPDALRGIAGQPRPESGHPLAGVGTYAFMDATLGWRPEEICLAYALTEPALASVLVVASTAGDVERLASVVERDMPPGLAAQIEMARFSTDPAPAARTLRRA